MSCAIRDSDSLLSTSDSRIGEVMSSIAIFVISLLIALTSILLTIVLRLKFPRTYFSLGQVIIGEREDISIRAIFARIGTPFFASMLVGISKLPNGFEIAGLSSFLTSFLVIWPVVLESRELLSYPALQRKRTLYLVYTLYVCASILIGLSGWLFGAQIAGIRLHELVAVIDSWTGIKRDIAVNGIISVLFGVPTAIFTTIFINALNRWKANVRSAPRIEEK